MKCKDCELDHAAGTPCSEAVAIFLEQNGVKLMNAVGRSLIVDRTDGGWPKPKHYRDRTQLCVDRVEQLKKRNDTASELHDYEELIMALEVKLLGRDNKVQRLAFRKENLLKAINNLLAQTD